MNLFLFFSISKTAMLIKISKLLIDPLLWKIVGFMSSIVAFTCFALGPSFQEVFGRWNLYKGVIYSIVSLSVITMMLFVKKCRRFTRSVMVETIVGFLVMMLTSIYSIWQDINSQNEEKGWDGRILKLCSFGAFGLMSLSWSRQLQLGFEVGISNFLFGSFLVLLIKMNFKLIPLAALVCYVALYIRYFSNHQRDMHSLVDSSDTVPEDIENGISHNIDLQPLIVDSSDTESEDIETGIRHNIDSQPLRGASSSSTPAWDFIGSHYPAGRSDQRFGGPFSGDQTPRGRESASLCDVVLEMEDKPKEWMARVEPGVHITFASLPNGGNDIKKIRFSREMFEKWQAQRWWEENYDRIMELYNVQNRQIYTPTRSEDEQRDSSRDEPSVGNGSDMETEWVEQDEPGVYITIRQLPDGTRELRRVRFNREIFGEVHAKNWWEENRERIQAQYL